MCLWAFALTAFLPCFMNASQPNQRPLKRHAWPIYNPQVQTAHTKPPASNPQGKYRQNVFYKKNHSSTSHHKKHHHKKSKKVKIVSPNGQLAAVVKLSDGQLTYKVDNKKGETIILPSSLGVVRADSDFTHDLSYVSIHCKKNDVVSYTNPLGKFSSQEILGTRASLVYENPQGKKLTVEFFVTDFAVSFRYQFLHEDRGMMINVKNESTTTTIPLYNSDSTAAQSVYKPYAWINTDETIFSGLHNFFDYQQSNVGLSFAPVPQLPQFGPNPFSIGYELPIYFKYDGYSIVVLQSGVTKDNTMLHFDANADGGVYTWTNALPNFESAGQFFQVDSIQPSGVGINDTTAELPWDSVWHIIYVTKNIADVQENDLVYALAPPNAIGDTSWIVPGNAAWNFIFESPTQFPIPNPVFTVSSASRDANGIVTVTTTTPNGFLLGDEVTITMNNALDASFNAVNAFVTPISSTQFTYLQIGSGAQTSVDGGSASVTSLNGEFNWNGLKQFMDLASFFGWPYVTIDSGWPIMSNVPGVPPQNCTCNTLDGNNAVPCCECSSSWDWNANQSPPNFAQRQALVTAIAAYGASLNPPVKTIFWYDAPVNALTGEQFSINPNLLCKFNRIPEFQMLQQAGAAGIKLDFQNWEIQIPMINMIDILADAAKYNLVVDIHDFYIPVGLERAYPNLLTNKFYWGSEWWTFFPPFAGYIPLATHLVRSYYLQAITGPTDMTPLLLLRLTGSSSDDGTYLLRNTTGAFMLACQLLYFSPLQTLSDAPSTYYATAADVPEVDTFLRTLPTVWDETVHLKGTLLDTQDPGSVLAVVARRKGSEWYIGGAVGSDAGIASAVRSNSGEVIVNTFFPHTFVVGDPINIVFADPANHSFNGDFTVTQVDSPTQFRYMQSPGSPLTSIPSGGGIVSRTLPKTITIDTTPLGLSGTHTVTQILDGPLPYGTDPTTVFSTVTSTQTFPANITVTMAPNGGFVMSIQ